MTDFEIFALSVLIPAIGGAVDLWSDRHQSDIHRRVTIVQWAAVFIAIYGGVRLAVVIPPLSEHLPLTTGIIASGATYAGMRLGLVTAKRLDIRAREQNAEAARARVFGDG